MKALGRPRFTNLVVLMFITLHVVLKEVLCNFNKNADTSQWNQDSSWTKIHIVPN